MDESAIYPMIIEVESFENQQQMVINWRKQFRNYLDNWTTLLQNSISYVIAEYGSLDPESFFMLPNPGMIAYAQYIHQISLRKSIFICENESMKSSLGANIGLKNVISSIDFFTNSGWDIASKIRKFSVDFSENYRDFIDIVIYPDMIRNSEFDHSGEFHSGIGRLHGTCIPSVSLEEFCFDEDEEFEYNLPKPVQLNESTSQPNNNTKEKSTNSLDDHQNDEDDDNIISSAPQQKIPSLSEIYIQSNFTHTNFERGMQYHHFKTIFNCRQNGFDLFGMCKGSSAPPYTINVKLSSKSEKICKSTCSCPIGTGKCKHVVAFLLSWVHNRELFKVNPINSSTPIPPSPIPPTPQQLKSKSNLSTPNNQPIVKTPQKPQVSTPQFSVPADRSEFLSSTPGGKRKLPRWMNEEDESPPKKQKISANKAKPINKKTNKKIKSEPRPSRPSNPHEIVEILDDDDDSHSHSKICEKLHLSPRNTTTNTTITTKSNSSSEKSKSPPRRIRTVEEILADLDKEFGSIPDVDVSLTQEKSNEEDIDHLRSTSPSRKKISVKERFANVGISI